MRTLAVLLLALAQSQGVSLSGSVVRVDTDAPVPGARLLLVPVGVDVRGSLVRVTDSGGRFLVNDLRPGEWHLFAEHDDFMRPSPVPLVVRAGEPVGPVTVAMVPRGVILGRVVDGTGEPVARVYVRAEGNGETLEARTNDLGEYRLFGVPPGRYLVSAAPYLPPRIDGATYVSPTPPSPFSRGEGQFMVPLARLLQAGDFIDPRALSGAGQRRVFYPGTTDRESAAPVDVRPGQTAGAIDFVLR